MTTNIETARAAILTAEQWYYDLAYTADGHHCHPLLPARELAEFPKSFDAVRIAEDLIEEGLVAPRAGGPGVPYEAAVDLIEYGLRALRAGQAIEACLTEAVNAYEAGDIENARRLLREAQGVELEYGDDPTVDAVASDLGISLEDED